MSTKVMRTLQRPFFHRGGTLVLILLLQSCTTPTFETTSRKKLVRETIKGGKTQPALAWRFVAPGPLGVPVTYDGVVYVGCGNRSDTSSGKNAFYAIDTKTGAKRWQFDVRGDLQSAPLVAKGALYFVSQRFHPTKTILISLDTRQGRERWRRPLNGMMVGELKWNRNGSIAIVTADSRSQRTYRGVVRRTVSPTTGRVLRKTSVERARRRSWSVPNPPAHVLALQWKGSVVYWGDSSQFQAFNMDTKKELWGFKHPRWAKSSKGGSSRGGRARRSQPWFFPPLFSGKIVLLGGNFARLYALRAATGQLLWKTRACSWGVMPLVTVGGVVLFSDLDRTVYAVDRRTGKTLWKVVEQERTTGQGEKGIISHGAAGVAVDRKGLYLASRNEVFYGYRFTD